MKLGEVLKELIELGDPLVNVGCFSKEDPDRHVQIRLDLSADHIGFNWTWFAFVDPDSPKWTIEETTNLYAEAAASDEWFLDEIELEPNPEI